MLTDLKVNWVDSTCVCIEVKTKKTSTPVNASACRVAQEIRYCKIRAINSELTKKTWSEI